MFLSYNTMQVKENDITTLMFRYRFFYSLDFSSLGHCVSLGLRTIFLFEHNGWVFRDEMHVWSSNL